MSDPVHSDRSKTQQPNEHSTRRSARNLLRTPSLVQGFCALTIAMVVGDLVTTMYGLAVGLQEQNPFVVAILARYGVAGLVGLKFVAVAWVAIIWRALGRSYGIAAMAGLLIPQAIAVALNLVTLFTA